MGYIYKLLMVLALVATAIPALADPQIILGATDRSINTLSTSSAQVLAAYDNRRWLVIHNPGATYKVACSLTGTTAVVNGYGSITLLPGSTLTLEGAALPKNAINCISENAAATGLTIWEG